MNLIIDGIIWILTFPITYILLFYVFYRIKQDERFKNRPVLGNLYNRPAIYLAIVGYIIGFITNIIRNFSWGVIAPETYLDLRIPLFLITTLFYLLGFWWHKKSKKEKG